MLHRLLSNLDDRRIERPGVDHQAAGDAHECPPLHELVSVHAQVPAQAGHAREDARARGLVVLGRDEALERVTDVLRKDLERTGVVYIGREGTLDGMFSRVVHLIKDPATRRLPRAGVVAAQAETVAA